MVRLRTRPKTPLSRPAFRRWERAKWGVLGWVLKAEALANAEEALSGYLASIFERGFEFPKASAVRGTHLVAPSLPVRTAILLRQLRTRLRLSQQEAARRLHTSYQACQKLENPRRCNPTLKTLERVGKAFHRSLTLHVR